MMMKQGGIMLSGRTILGLCLVVIGFLTLGYGGVEFGFGCDIYLPYFKLCPELKFCFGLADVLEPDRSDLANPLDRVYSQALSRATSRLIVLTFNFE